MSIEIVLNVSPRETRAALLENGVLQELFVERASRRGLTGNLYKGRVSRVLPGMQAAFIDIGLERTAFPACLRHRAAGRCRGRRRCAAHRQHPRTGERGRATSSSRCSRTRSAPRVPVSRPSSPSRRAIWSCMPLRPGRRRVRAHRERGGTPAPARSRAGAVRSKARTAVTSCARRPRARRPEALRADMLFLRRLWDVLGRARRRRHAPGRSCTRTSLAAAPHARPGRRGRRARARGPRGELRRTCASSPRRSCRHIGHASRALHRQPADLRPARRRGRDPALARPQGGIEVRRVPDHRPDRGADDHRRQHRRLCRASQSRGDDLPYQPRGRGRDRAPAAAAQPRRHHHHRLHRHAGGGAPPAGAAGAREGARQGPRQDARIGGLAARPRRDDAQTHA